jgi:16S rRNA (uracil1498-N3)-methyltransferase
MFYVPDLATFLPSRPAPVSVALPDDESKHAGVLRLAVGSPVQLCDGRGRVVQGKVDVVGSKKQPARVLVEGVEVVAPVTSTAWHVAVACGSLKGSRGDWLVEKCAEIGAATLTPVLTARSQRVGAKERERYERIAVSVMKQSLQAWKMDVCAPCGLFEYLDGLDAGRAASATSATSATSTTRVFVGAESAGGFGEVLCACREPSVDGRRVEKAVVLVGPEGDFTPEELEGLLARGVTPVGLGARRLRTETAAVVMLSAGIVALE